jgi:hypothetical protein
MSALERVLAAFVGGGLIVAVILLLWAAAQRRQVGLPAGRVV